MVGLVNLNQVRSQEYAREYLWDLYFPSFEAETGIDWFPAVDVEEGMASVNSQEFPQFISTYKLPATMSANEMSITWADFVDHKLNKWLMRWIASIFPIEQRGPERYQWNACLSEIVREVQIVKLFPWAAEDSVSRRRAEISRKSYLVYPEGDVRSHGSSDNNVKLHTQNFVIVGS